MEDMKITNQKTLKEVQMEFNEKFPYLKIEFYEGKHETGKPSPVNKQLDASMTIQKARKTNTEGDLNITGQLKVSTLEDRFWEQYGLNVQVFRRSGNLWLQTSTTDHWTLTQQNGKGERSERSYEEMHNEE